MSYCQSIKCTIQYPLCKAVCLYIIFRIHGELGSGEFGVVTCGRLTKPPHEEVEVAIKMLNPGASDKDKLRFIQEAAIMCQFDHKNVIKLYGVVTESPRMIVLEYMSRGDLRNLLLKLKSLLVVTYMHILATVLEMFANKLYFNLLHKSI